MKLTDCILQKIRSADTFGVYKRLQDNELIMKYFEKKYIEFEESFSDLSEDKIYKIKLFFEALAFLAERVFNFEVNCCSDISKEGFGKVIIYSEYRILAITHLRNLGNFGFKNIEDIDEYGDKMIKKMAERISQF